MRVSIIIPAYNAAATIAETLESVLAQTFAPWEAIVVDDGSSDHTVDIVTNFINRDSRFRLVRQPNAGVSAARNTGITQAHYDWLLFLDADDWLSLQHLEKLTRLLVSNPGLGVAYCGYIRINPNGKVVDEGDAPEPEDLFAISARYCPFAIHACVVQKALVETVGGFDTALRVCQDWDLWQRIARSQARCGVLHERLALYRLRPGSNSFDIKQLFIEGLRIIAQGHTIDPRVSNPHPVYANGISSNQLLCHQLYFLCWCASFLLGRGEKAHDLFDAINEGNCPQISALIVAQNLFSSIILPKLWLPEQLVELWPSLKKSFDEFLGTLEKRTQAEGLAHHSRAILEGMMLEHAKAQVPLTLGTRFGLRVDILKPLSDIVSPGQTERVRCHIDAGELHLGSIELPVFDQSVPRYVLADAIVAELAWQILYEFLKHSIYPKLEFKKDENGVSAWRGAICLAQELLADEKTRLRQIHDQAGWLVFLQELWGRPDWPLSHFYNPEAVLEPVHLQKLNDGWLTIEISQTIPDVQPSGKQLNVLVAMGGVALGVVTIPAQENIIRAHEIRTIINKACGFELCRVAIREGVLGHNFVQPFSLHDRLAAARTAQTFQVPQASQNSAFASRWHQALDKVISSVEHSVLLARRVHGEIDTSQSRRAMLPSAAVDDIIATAAITGEPVLNFSKPALRPTRIVYSPELVGRSFTSYRTPLPKATENVLWHGGKPTLNNAGQTVQTDWLPILRYHRVAPAGSPATARCRITPETFEEQLHYLRDTGFYSISLEDWRNAMAEHKPLPGHAVLITFDDGYLDFMTYAWPLLQRYRFSATVFLVAGEVGHSNRWNRMYGEEVPLLGWQEIRQLQQQGVEFGSHTVSHPHLTALSPTEIVRELIRSRAILTQELQSPIKAFAYPYGDTDRVVQHLVSACGYLFGLTCRAQRSGLWDSLLALPRIEVTGSDSLQGFVSKLGC